MSTRPNFLLVITDQHRADHLGCYGNRIVRTPNIDRLAAEGVAFDRFYVASPICMPNRATLMTGRMPSLHGVRHNGIPLSLDATTFVDVLRGAGYRTAMVGKSHLQNMTGDPPRIPPKAYDPAGPADAAAMVPARRRGAGRYDQELSAKWRDDPGHEIDLPYYGFDVVDLAIEHGDEVEGHYTRWLRDRRPDGDSLRGEAVAEDQDWERDPRLAAPQARRTLLPEELYPTSYVAERTIARLEEFARRPGQPFFLKCSFPDPHHPFTPPGRYWDMYDPADIPLPESWHFDRAKAPPPLRWLLDQRDAGKAVRNTPMLFAATEREVRAATALTYGMITMIDDAVGRILVRLAALGLDKNTIVAFMSDHGDFMGDHQLMLKGPIHYRSIIRTPFLWRDPAAPRGRRATLASTLDLARTVLERAGLPPIQGMQGRSLLSAITGDTVPARDLLVEEEGQRIYLGFDRRVRLRTLITERHRLSVYDGASWGEIYDLNDDPHECENLWDDPACRALRGELVERLARTMIAHSDTHPYPTGLA